MSDPEEVRAIARALAARLEHERRFKGVRYAPVPSADESIQKNGVRTPVAQASAPAHVREGGGSARAPDVPRESVAEVRARAVRAQAQEWTPARKLDYLRERNVGDCRRCVLSRTRTNIVFGVGDPAAELMFVGEAPGADEDRRGEPFVGRAGQRLDQWLVDLGLERSRVYIANVLKCRPPGNRDPEPEEIERCSPFLLAQVRAIEPRVLIALGRFAGNMLLAGGPAEAARARRSMRSMQGKVHEFVESKTKRRIPLIVTYHPSYVLRRERDSGGPGSENAPPRNPENDLVLDDLRRALALARASD